MSTRRPSKLNPKWVEARGFQQFRKYPHSFSFLFYFELWPTQSWSFCVRWKQVNWRVVVVSVYCVPMSTFSRRSWLRDSTVCTIATCWFNAYIYSCGVCVLSALQRKTIYIIRLHLAQCTMHKHMLLNSYYYLYYISRFFSVDHSEYENRAIAIHSKLILFSSESWKMIIINK